MITVTACMCGSSESTARNFLKSINYPEWMSVPVHHGKEKAKSILNQLPPVPEKEMLEHFLENASKWVVVVGYNEKEVKWSDISHNVPKSTIEAEFVVKKFGFA